MPTLLEWQQINSFATWFSASGSIFSSCVALYLARQSSIEKLKIDYVFQSDADSKKSLGVRITNVGVKPVSLKQCSILTPNFSRIGGGLGDPIKLQYGESYNIDYPMEPLLEYSNNKTIIEVYTTTQRFFRKLPRKAIEFGNNIEIR